MKTRVRYRNRRRCLLVLSLILCPLTPFACGVLTDSIEKSGVALELLSADSLEAELLSNTDTVRVALRSGGGENLVDQKVVFNIYGVDAIASPAEAITDANGEATTVLTFGTVAGSGQLVARVAGATNQVEVDLEALPGKVAKLFSLVTDDLSGFTNSLTFEVLAVDTFGNRINMATINYLPLDSGIELDTTENFTNALGIARNRLHFVDPPVGIHTVRIQHQAVNTIIATISGTSATASCDSGVTP